jgi:hypothetical protein
VKVTARFLPNYSLPHNNDHVSIDYPSIIGDAANLFFNRLYTADNILNARHSTRQINYDWIRSWITSRYFAHWVNDIFGVGVKEI